MRGPRAVAAESATRNRIGAEQVAGLFRNVTLGVLAAALTAWVVALGSLGNATIAIEIRLSWAGAVSLAALTHLALLVAYRRRAEPGQWQAWALAFSAIALVEGILWGAMPVAVAINQGFETEMIGVVVALGLAAGAIPAFSSYYPAFAAFLLTTTLPYAFWSAAVPGTMHPATTILMFIFALAFIALGLAANRSFKQLVALRLEAADLAARLSREKEIAETANRSKSSFLAAASHDLRQPVHALGLFVGALRNVPMNRQGKDLVAQIEASTNAMDGLFTALLDISRLDAGIVEIHESAFKMGMQLERICTEHAGEAAAKGAELRWVRSEAIVYSDPVLIERILRNLISNAIRYTQRGRILVGCRRRGKYVAIQVIDTGRGIPEELQEHVFEEFYQLDNPERDRTKGLGLGLAIVRRLADLLHVGVRLRSKVGKGSTFEIVVQTATSEMLPAAQSEDRRGPASGLVVVIDDEKAIRDGMSALLSGWGHEVVCGASGDEIVERLSSFDQKPVLIISDYRLGGHESGIAVVERLQTEYNEAIPAILITGDTSPERLAEAHVSGLLLLHKPVQNGRLRAAIANLVKAPKSDAGSPQIR